MKYKKYKTARNAAWRVLLQCNVRELPVDVREICRTLGVRLYSYRAGVKLIQAFHAEEQARRSEGFTVFYRGEAYIFYDDTAYEPRQRFTLAHEIGHVILGHFLGEGNRGQRPEEETQANQFAARLLAPACVLNALNAVTAEEIAALCGMSREAAGYRADRMRQLRERGKFLTHPLERRVLRRFKPFIKSHLESP